MRRTQEGFSETMSRNRVAAFFAAVVALGAAAAPLSSRATATNTPTAVDELIAELEWDGSTALPRFESLRFDEVNGRSGPSFQHAVSWTYRHAGLPVEVIAETEGWKQVRDADGDLVWIHERMFSKARTVMVDPHATAAQPILRAASDRSPTVAFAMPGVVLGLKGCHNGWCAVTHGAAQGFVQASTLWGLYPEETERARLRLASR